MYTLIRTHTDISSFHTYPSFSLLYSIKSSHALITSFIHSFKITFMLAFLNNNFVLSHSHFLLFHVCKSMGGHVDWMIVRKERIKEREREKMHMTLGLYCRGIGSGSYRCCCRWCWLLSRFFNGQQLFSTESFIMNLCCGFNQVLQMSSRQKVAQMNKLAMILILHVDHTPSCLSSTYCLAIHNHVTLRANNCERDQILWFQLLSAPGSFIPSILLDTYANVFIQWLFLFIVFFTLIGIESNIMECQFSLDLSCHMPYPHQ